MFLMSNGFKKKGSFRCRRTTRKHTSFACKTRCRTGNHVGSGRSGPNAIPLPPNRSLRPSLGAPQLGAPQLGARGPPRSGRASAALRCCRARASSPNRLAGSLSLNATCHRGGGGSRWPRVAAAPVLGAPPPPPQRSDKCLMKHLDLSP